MSLRRLAIADRIDKLQLAARFRSRSRPIAGRGAGAILQTGERPNWAARLERESFWLRSGTPKPAHCFAGRQLT